MTKMKNAETQEKKVMNDMAKFCIVLLHSTLLCFVRYYCRVKPLEYNTIHNFVGVLNINCLTHVCKDINVL